MISSTARLLTLLAVFLCGAGCAQPGAKTTPTAPTPTSSGTLAASPRRIVGRILAIDRERGFAFIDVAADAPAPALTDGAPLLVRTLDLSETARLRASRYVRGRTLGATIVSGQPSPGDEVVWLAP